ncbi:hypothetical protein IMZ48_46645 [Candidatus Bathyarchaeota archaeon]|nr:hypothetical protein [Candidatus Bathyarchaeota archaeon]
MSPGVSQQPMQLPQHFRQTQHSQQQDTPQQQHRTIHQTTEKRIRLPIMMTAITGHLGHGRQVSKGPNLTVVAR